MASLSIGPGITVGPGVAVGGGSAPPSPTPVNTVAPAVTGTLTAGSTLTSTTGTWTNSPSSYTYQWYYSTNTPISGATSSTYVTQTGDVGDSIYCQVTATNTYGSASANSNTVGPVISLTPVNTVAPAVTGSLTLGATLTSTTGTWTNSPSSYTYQWYYSTNTPISGATSSTYVTQSGDVGDSIYCQVTATNTYGSTSANSNTVGPVTAVTVTYLAVAGGGGGGVHAGGGGGAGGVLSGTFFANFETTYSITVGTGGVGTSDYTISPATNGGNSTISGTGLTTIIAIGGGAAENSSGQPNIGGSGGGGNPNNSGVRDAQNTGAAGTVGQGYAGGNASNSNPNVGPGGGGGAGGIGASNAGQRGGAVGGPGISSSITGTAVYTCLLYTSDAADE